jgi:hypothetical protein
MRRTMAREPWPVNRSFYIPVKSEVGQTIGFVVCQPVVLERGMTDHERRWSVPPGLLQEI